MRISVEVIPKTRQRYSTLGDWIFDSEGDLHVYVTKVGDWKKECLIAVHEIVEAMLCKNNNTPEVRVFEFDLWHNKASMKKQKGTNQEPGDHPDAPYRDEHCFATAVERMLCAAMSMSWDNYEKELEKYE